MSPAALPEKTQQRIRRLSQYGHSSAEIAAAVGCSAQTAYRYSDPKLRRKPHSGPRWKKHEERFLARLVNSKTAYSASEIGALCSTEFGRKITKSAVIVKVRRLGLKLKGKPCVRAASAVKKPAAPRPRHQWPPEREAALMEIANDRAVGSVRAAAAAMTTRFGERFSEPKIASKLKRMGVNLPFGDGRGKDNYTGNGPKRVGGPPPKKPAFGRKMNHAPLGPTRGLATVFYGREVLSAGQDPAGCRFVHGYPGSDETWRYCQQKTGGGETYCAAHQALVAPGRPQADETAETGKAAA